MNVMHETLENELLKKMKTLSPIDNKDEYEEVLKLYNQLVRNRIDQEKADAANEIRAKEFELEKERFEFEKARFNAEESFKKKKFESEEEFRQKQFEADEAIKQAEIDAKYEQNRLEQQRIEAEIKAMGRNRIKDYIGMGVKTVLTVVTVFGAAKIEEEGLFHKFASREREKRLDDFSRK